MRLIKKAITLLLIWSLAILPMLEAMNQEQLSPEPEAGKVIILSDKVGEIIDQRERDYYKLPLGSKNFRSAVILQLPDSSLVIQITEMKEGVQQQLIMQVDQEILEEFRKNIEKKPKIIGAMDQAKIIGVKDQAKIFEAKEQAKILAKEKWTKERWREEILSDREGTYRGVGGLLGFTLGAAVGMLVGKGIQEKKVKRTEFHTDGWWTEEFYSYKHKYAPHWGAFIGGISGAVAGYFLGRKADKEYYILVPKNIRMQSTKTSGFGNFLFGFGVTGPLMGIMTGNMLYAPKSAREGQDIGGVEFFMGYLPGAIIGMTLIDGYKRRAKHIRFWENSI
ncbi:MAG: hypothetical protein KAW92_04235, partial [Candidatus Cloacimonetes bacterium]|nr:hypothetical protein [Candidatus Cloacimonadota bacterium]